MTLLDWILDCVNEAKTDTCWRSLNIFEPGSPGSCSVHFSIFKIIDIRMKCQVNGRHWTVHGWPCVKVSRLRSKIDIGHLLVNINILYCIITPGNLYWCSNNIFNPFDTTAQRRFHFEILFLLRQIHSSTVKSFTQRARLEESLFTAPSSIE